MSNSAWVWFESWISFSKIKSELRFFFFFFTSTLIKAAAIDDDADVDAIASADDDDDNEGDDAAAAAWLHSSCESLKSQTQGLIWDLLRFFFWGGSLRLHLNTFRWFNIRVFYL